MVSLSDVKTALRVTTTEFDSEITSLMNACLLDLQLSGVVVPSSDDELINIAVITYTKARFGNPDNYDKLKTSYDEQKAQLSMATGYTVWSVEDGQV